MPAAGRKQSKSERDLLVSLAISDINLARVFAVGARLAFSSGKVADGEFARLRTVKFYCEALRSLLRMTPVERESFSSDLQYLRTQIEWLSMQTGVSLSPTAIQEEASMEKLLKLLEETG